MGGAGALPPALSEAGVTPREAEVLRVLTERRSNAEIAAELFISVRTVESHVSSLLLKLGADDRSALAAIGRSLLAESTQLPLALAELTERGRLVGRERELSALRRSWEAAAGGRRQLALIAGAAGIGKSRLAAELAAAVHTEGATVLLGHCDEEALAPYQPFTEVLSSLARGSPPAALATALAGAGPELPRLVPELAALVPAGIQTGTDPPEIERHRLFETVVALLKAAADVALVLLVLEDLQWADKPSLLLFKHLVRRAERSPLLVLGTYRDRPTDPGSSLLELISDLRREHDFEHINLRGLSPLDVRELLADRAGSVVAGTLPLAETLCRQTEGNPFFIREILHDLAERNTDLSGRREGPAAGIEGLAVPEGVREVITRRVARLAASTEHVLSVAAVAGQSFRLDVLARVTGLEEETLLDAIDEARSANMVAEIPGEVDAYRFAHDLLRQTLYERLSASRRVRLHRSIGDVLETLAPGDLAELAYHLSAAASLGDKERAVRYAAQAADQAGAVLAHEQAAHCYQLALDALGKDGTPHARRFELALAQGHAHRRAGDPERARTSFLAAIEAALLLDDPKALARAALGLGEASAIWGVDDELVEVLSQALSAVGDQDPGLTARLLSRLAQARYYSASAEERAELSRRAVAMARRAGDVATLATVLSARHVALWGPEDLDERVAVADEIVSLAREIGDEELLLRGHAWRLVDLLEMLDLRGVDRSMSEHSRLAAELRQPLHVRDAAAWRVMRALLDGRYADAELELEDVLALGERAHDPHAVTIYWIQRYWLVFAMSGPEQMRDLVEVYRDLAEHHPQVPAWRGALALIYTQLELEDDARAEFERLAVDDFGGVPRDAVWLNCLTYLAEVSAFLDDQRRSRVLFELLLPYANRTVVIDRGLVCKGSVSRFLGLLAWTTGNHVEAVDHLEAALALHRRMQAGPLVAYTQCDLARALIGRGENGDVDSAAEYASEALVTAEALGSPSLLASSRAALSGL